MDVNELVGLAVWMSKHVKPAMPTYESLVSSMEQNAASGSKVPLREYLDAIQKHMLKMPVSELSYQQSDLLEALGVVHLIGKDGWRFIERSLKEATYDPASAATDVRKAKHKIDESLEKINQVYNALFTVGIEGSPDYDSSEKVTVRIRFKDDVEITNVTQLKKWSGEWYDIARGLAMAAGERPEDIEVKGATTGSIIVILGTSLTVATILALIMKQVASTVKSSVEIAHTLQDWKMRRIADAEVERVLLARQKGVEDSGVQVALDLVKEEIGARISGDVENALKKSIEKTFSFAAKGGEVDMLPPPSPSEEDEVDATVAEAIAAITDNVEEMRSLKAETRLLIEGKGQDANGGEAAE